MDWDLGHYEHMAAQLRPAAAVVVETLAPRRDEVVIDVGCGTGNATLILAARGASVTGIDPSPRLLEVARTAAAADGLAARFESGVAASLPADDSSADGIVSVFGAIFAPDPTAVAAEFARVLSPGGRIVLSAWLRDGPLAAQATLRRELVAQVRPEGSGGALFAWHDPDALTELFAAYGFEVATREHVIAFTDRSPQTYTDSDLANHPLWVEARAVLESAGAWASVRDQLLELFTVANEDPDAFRITSRYVVATIRHKTV
jgi:ubiquinone/menaquinone biosynthesis C-methylase UbiE